jgi:hypothetical protein
MIKLVESSGTIIYDSGNKIFICKKPSQWTTTALFVTGLLSFIFIVNGVLQLFVFKNAQNATSTIGIVLLALGTIFSLIVWRILAYRKKINSMPFEKLKKICVLDFTNNSLLDSNNTILTSLDDVTMKRKMQLASSSPKLILKWNKKSLVIVNGSPFSGGVTAVEGALISKGVNN